MPSPVGTPLSCVALQDVLRYATFLDTPGLRDPDPKRRRIAIDNIAKMDGWIYLMQAGKAETGVLDDLAEIRDEAGNMHGVICISKVNLLNDPSAQKTLEQLVKPQRDLFQSCARRLRLQRGPALGPRPRAINTRPCPRRAATPPCLSPTTRPWRAPRSR
jgi:hypothetical protein